MATPPYAPAALLALLVLPVLLAAAPLSDPPAEKTYYLTVPLAREGQAVCAIVPPAGDDWAAVARALQALLQRSGATIPILEAKAVRPGQERDRTLILLGTFANNPAVLPLYHGHYLMSDDVWPGAGGYELRTVHDPFGTGASVLYLGGSDPAGVQAAVGVLGTLLPAGPTLQLPATIRVCSAGRSPGAGDPAKVPAQVQQLSGLQFREVASRVCAAGLAYHATGDLAQAEYFRLGLPALAAIVAKMDRVTDARGSVLLPLICDLVEEAPALTAADRNAMFRFLWEYANKCPNAGQKHEPGVKPQGNNWDARANWAAAAYFHKYYQQDVAGLWTWCETYFGKGGQARFWKTSEDCPGYGSITYHDLLFYGLSRGDLTWLESGKLRQAADYGLLIINNLGAISGFGDTSEMSGAVHWPSLLLAAAWYYRDGRYRYLYDLLPEKSFSAAEYVYNHYLDNSVKPVEPVDMLGIKAQPLDRWIHEHPQEALSSGTPVDRLLDAQPVPPYEKCFDKLCLRTGFRPDQQYLLLGGISHGYHSHPDGNAIIGYTDNGKYMLFDNGYFVPDTIEHNTLAIYRDGFFKPVPRFTTLEQRVDWGGGAAGELSLCQTQVADYNGADWRRNLIWAKEKWFLCVDEVQAQEAGDYGLTCIWRTIGDLDLRADRFCSRQGEVRFSLVNADGAPSRVTGTTPPAANRKAVMQSSNPRLKSGEKTWFLNLFYSPEGKEDFPCEVVAAGPGQALVRDGERVVYAGVGGKAEAGLPQVEAALFAVTDGGFTLAAGTGLEGGSLRFKSDRPVGISADLGAGQAHVAAREGAKVSLPAGKGACHVDGKTVTVPRQGDLAVFTVPAGSHVLAFPPAKRAAGPGLAAQYERLLKARQARRAATEAVAGKPAGLKLLWERDHAAKVARTIYHPLGAAADEAHAIPDLARLGKPAAWTEGSAGCHPAAAMDDDPETYSAVGSGAANVTALPKDLGVEWPEPRQVAQVRVRHYDKGYLPAADGHDLQYWDGTNWVSLDDSVTGTDSAQWVHTFAPVKTTRVRLLVTKFGGMRTAVRSFEVFAEPVEAAEVLVRQAEAVVAVLATDLGTPGPAAGAPARHVVAAAGKTLSVCDAAGAVLWEATLPAPCADLDTADLNRDGAQEIVVAAGTTLYCYDAAGKRLWEAACPKDKYYPEVEPAQGPFRVLHCDDLNGDGFPEVIAGSGNWFTYAFTHEGKLLWGTLNWAHQPTAIATVAVEGGKRAALVGNTYCSANLFSAEGKQIGDVPVGYHGAATAVAAGDLDGDGKPELIAGSRIGGVHCRPLGAETAWDLQCGAEITATELADVDGNGRPELLIASRNCYVIAVEAAGKTLWRYNCGRPVRALAVTGAGATAAVAAGVDGGGVVVLDGTGQVQASYPIPADVVRVALADLDGDGRAEVVAGTADGRTYVLKRG